MAKLSKTDKIIETLEHEIAIRQYAIDRLREQATPRPERMPTGRNTRIVGRVTGADRPAKESA